MLVDCYERRDTEHHRNDEEHAYDKDPISTRNFPSPVMHQYPPIAAPVVNAEDVGKSSLC